MASIEDLLNSSDSDDEFDSNNVDLESLLLNKGDDSDEELDIKYSYNKTATTRRTSNVAIDQPSETISTSNISGKIVAPNAKNELNLPDLNLSTTKPVYEYADEQEDTVVFNSLEMADLREQRFLKTGGREVISALQAKRNSSVLNSYSNIKLEDLATISSQLKRNSNYKQHGPGAASSVLVTSRFVAVGTTRGLVIIFDHSQEIRQVVGSAVQLPARSGAPVTALDVTQQASGALLLLCGYATGEVALWDVLKGAVVKRINDLHLCKVTRVAFLRSIGDGLANPTSGGAPMVSDLVAVTADLKGVLHKTRFVKALWTAFTHESECLLDGTSGGLSDLCPLSPFNEQPVEATAPAPSAEQQQPIKLFSGLMRAQPAAQFLSFNFAAQTCIVQVAPFVKIVHKWAAPARGSSPVVEGTAAVDWHWRSSGKADADRQLDAVPLLARCWGSTVEILGMDVAPVTAADGSGEASGFRRSSTATGVSAKDAKYEFSVLHQAQFDGQQFVSVKWLSATRLVATSLTSVVVLSQLLDLVEKAPLTQSVVSNFQALLSSRASADDPVFMNATCVSGRHLYLLSADFLLKLQLQSCFDMAHQLVHNGQWLEALALILENVSKSPSLLASNAAEVDQCILRYVELAVQQPVLSSASSVSSPSQSRNHYHLVAGVCIEYCVAAQRTELLYGDLFDIFTAAHQQVVFLESLEPYILARTISVLPPNIIAEFFESSLRHHRLPSIERCVTYFDIHSVDLDFVTRFLFEHRMFSSFLYAFANGLGDFAGAFQIIFAFMIPSAGGPATAAGDDEDRYSPLTAAADSAAGLLRDGAYPNPDQADIGYKLLLFLLYTFDGRVFPRGDAHPYSRSTVMSLLTLVTDRTLRRTPTTFSASGEQGVGADASQSGGALYFSGDFPYLTCLSYVDPQATLHCLARGLEVVQQVSPASPRSGAARVGELVETDGNESLLAEQLSGAYEHLFAFCALSEGDPALATYRMQTLFLEKCLDQLTACTCQLDARLLEAVVRYCAGLPSRGAMEGKMVQLAERQSRYAKNCVLLKQLLCDHNFWSASLSVRRAAPPVANPSSQVLPVSAVGNPVISYEKALKYYIAACKSALSPQPTEQLGENSAPQALFSYVDHQYAQLSQSIGADGEEQKAAFSREVVKVLVDLHAADAARCTQMVCAQLSGFTSEIVVSTKQEPKVQFELLHAIVLSLESEETSSAGSQTLKDCFSPRTVAALFKLLCVYDPARVFAFLQRYSEFCPAEECLALCKEHGISDALSYLLERRGDLSEALAVLQRDITQRVKAAKREIDSQLRVDLATASSSKAGMSVRGASGKDAPDSRSLVSQILSKQGAARVEATMRLPVYRSLAVIVNCAADLCAAHATPADPHMWFAMFDHLLLERQSIRSGVMSSSGEIVIVLIGLMLQTLMSKMKGVIAPQDIIRRVTTQGSAAGVRLGEFKDVVSNMLAGNAHELYLHQEVNAMIRADLVQLHRQKVAVVRRACYRSHGDEDQLPPAEEGFDPEERQPLSPSGAPSSSERRSKWQQRAGGSRKRFRKFSELRGGDSSQLLTCVPAVLGAFSTDFETRTPGSLSAAAVYTAQLHL